MSAAPEPSYGRRAGEDYREHRIAMADGIKIYVRDYPARAPETGVPVFCLHGLTRNSKDFELVAPRIAALGRRTIAWDTRGRGQSDRDPDPAKYNAAIYAQDALKAMDELGIGKAVFLGTSMGGIITMIVASLALPRIAAAALNDVGVQLDPVGIARIGGYVGKTNAVTTWESAASAVRTTQSVAFPDADPAFWMRAAKRTFRETPGGLEPDYDPMIALAFQAPGDAAAADLSPLFQVLAQVPVLLIRGGISDLLSPDTVAKMRGLKPDLDVAEVPRVGHAPTLEEEAAWDALIAFLAKVP